MVLSLIYWPSGKSKGTQSIPLNQSFQTLPKEAPKSNASRKKNSTIRSVSTLCTIIIRIKIQNKCLLNVWGSKRRKLKVEQKIKQKTKIADELNRLNLQEERIDVVN